MQQLDQNLGLSFHTFHQILPVPLQEFDFRGLARRENVINLLNILCSRENPKILWVDDSEIVCDPVTIGAPVLRHIVA